MKSEIWYFLKKEIPDFEKKKESFYPCTPGVQISIQTIVTQKSCVL